jgi:hypothetical protein
LNCGSETGDGSALAFGDPTQLENVKGRPAAADAPRID